MQPSFQCSSGASATTSFGHGFLAPEALVDHAAERGLSLLLSDGETLAGQPALHAHARGSAAGDRGWPSPATHRPVSPDRRAEPLAREIRQASRRASSSPVTGRGAPS